MANLEETRAWASTFFADLRFNGKNGTLPYRLHLPGRYERGKTYPLVLLMHGYGSIGSNNWGQLFFCGLFANNPNVDLDNVFILAPQCPADGTWIEITDDDKWLGVNYTMSKEPVAPMKIAMEILDHVVSSYPIDRKRLYVGGNSMGGFATWDILSQAVHWYNSPVHSPPTMRPMRRLREKSAHHNPFTATRTLCRGW